MIDQLVKYIRDIGFDFTPDLSNIPKKWISVVDDIFKGAYIFDTYPLKDKTEMLVFTIYDYRSGQTFTEKFCTRELTGGEAKSVQKKIEEQKAIAEKEREAKWEECKLYCETEYGNASAGDGGPNVTRSEYLARKGITIPPDSYRTRANALDGRPEILVGLNDADGNFWGYQIIREDGQKQFNIGQRIDGVFCHMPGKLNTRIYICEGFATAASIHESLKGEYSIYAALTATNLKKVAHALRLKYPKTPIVICADNDKWKPHIGNTGVQAAEDVAETLDGIAIAIPDFTQIDESTHPTDYNDLHVLAGVNEVRKQLESVHLTRPEIIYPIGYGGSRYFFTTARNPQIQVLSEFTSTDCLKLATKKYWELRFSGARGGIDYEAVKSTLIDQCQQIGLFEPSKIRGRGVWLDKSDTVIHMGNKLFSLEQKQEFNIQDYTTQFFYDPRASLDIPPFEKMDREDVIETERLLSDLAFETSEDYKLFMGWLMLAPIAGCLEWRPHLMMMAEAGSGKSTIMNHILDPVFSILKPFKKENTTEAGIRQTIGPDAAIALFDEFDTNGGISDKGRLQGIINLARVASSGGSVARGTTNGRALGYNANFIALFSGVNPPKLMEADKSRIAEITLTKNHKRLNWNEFRAELSHFQFLGAKLFWRSATLAKNIIDSIKVLHQAVGGVYGARAGQQYGALLAGYWHWHKDEVISEADAVALIKKLIYGDREEKVNVAEDSHDCLEHLFNLQVHTDNERRKILLAELVGGRETTDVKNQVLQGFGMTIKDGKLFIPNKHPELIRHFSATQWVEWNKNLIRRGGERGQINRGGFKSRGIWLKVDSPKDAF